LKNGYTRHRVYDRDVAQLSTPRLVLRQWRDDDLVAFAELNADPEVMRHFPAPLTRAESDELAARLRSALALEGWGLWAVEVRDVAPFIGFIGLDRVPFEAHFTPATEVGWRLDRRHWRRGYATEGARAAATFAFENLACEEIVSFTAASNWRSISVMQRLGMTHDAADDFDHPGVLDPELRRHVLYRLSRTRGV
jgi:RimJ/RimL family protein N-acetyltransferase